MKIILTDHSKQRRPYLKIESDAFLIKWMRYFEDLFDLENKKNGVFKISNEDCAAIFRKDDDKIILITFWGFVDFENRDDLELQFKRVQDHIYIKDDLGNFKICGKIKWESLTSLITIDEDIFYSYRFPFESREIPFKKMDYLNDTFYFENGKWILKDFPKNKNGNSVFRINSFGKIVKCGDFVKDKLYLDEDLMDKYFISIYKTDKKYRSQFIHFENGLWMLNNFERRG